VLPLVHAFRHPLGQGGPGLTVLTSPTFGPLSSSTDSKGT